MVDFTSFSFEDLRASVDCHRNMLCPEDLWKLVYEYQGILVTLVRTSYPESPGIWIKAARFHKRYTGAIPPDDVEREIKSYRYHALASSLADGPGMNPYVVFGALFDTDSSDQRSLHFLRCMLLSESVRKWFKDDFLTDELFVKRRAQKVQHFLMNGLTCGQYVEFQHFDPKNYTKKKERNKSWNRILKVERELALLS
jgi:hypothetical protein